MLTKLSAADLALPSVVTTMSDMPGNKAGAAMRLAILAALLEREPQTVRGLARATGSSETNIRQHVARMAEDGFLTVERRAGRGGSQVRLSVTGREAAKLI